MLKAIVQVRCRNMRSHHEEPSGQGGGGRGIKLTAVAQGITKHQGGDIRGAFEGGGRTDWKRAERKAERGAKVVMNIQ